MWFVVIIVLFSPVVKFLAAQCGHAGQSAMPCVSLWTICLLGADVLSSGWCSCGWRLCPSHCCFFSGVVVGVTSWGGCV